MWLFKSYQLDKYDLSRTTLSSLIWPIKIHSKKQQQNIGEEKSTNTENQKHTPVPSITPLFNLLALRNKHLYLKSECTQNIEFDDNIWIFIFLLIAEKQDFVDLNTILWKFQMNFAQILDTVIMIYPDQIRLDKVVLDKSYLSSG
jgi:hypothetical protein